MNIRDLGRPRMFEMQPFETKPSPELREVTQTPDLPVKSKLGLIALARGRKLGVETSPIEPPKKERHLRIFK